MEPFTKGKGMLNDYEKGIVSNNSQNRRVTVVPSLRTDLIGGKINHKTHLMEKEDYSMMS